MADEAGKGGEGTRDVEEGVTNGVAKGCFGGGAAGEKMVAIGVEEGVCVAGTVGIEEGVWEDGKAEFALEKEAEEVGRDAVLGVLAAPLSSPPL